MSCFDHPESYFHLNDEETFEPECWLERRRQIRQASLRLDPVKYGMHGKEVAKFGQTIHPVGPVKCAWPECPSYGTHVHIAGTEARPALIDLCAKHHRKGMKVAA